MNYDLNYIYVNLKKLHNNCNKSNFLEKYIFGFNTSNGYISANNPFLPLHEILCNYSSKSIANVYTSVFNGSIAIKNNTFGGTMLKLLQDVICVQYTLTNISQLPLIESYDIIKELYNNLTLSKKLKSFLDIVLDMYKESNNSMYLNILFYWITIYGIYSNKLSNQNPSFDDIFSSMYYISNENIENLHYIYGIIIPQINFSNYIKRYKNEVSNIQISNNSCSPYNTFSFNNNLDTFHNNFLSWALKNTNSIKVIAPEAGRWINSFRLSLENRLKNDDFNIEFIVFNPDCKAFEYTKKHTHGMNYTSSYILELKKLIHTYKNNIQVRCTDYLITNALIITPQVLQSHMFIWGCDNPYEQKPSMIVPKNDHFGYYDAFVKHYEYIKSISTPLD